MDLQTFSYAIGIVGALAALIIGVVKLVDAKVSKVELYGDDLRKTMNSRYETLHARINEVKEDYVRQRDHERDINRIESSIGEVKSDLSSQISRVENTLSVHIGQVNSTMGEILNEVRKR